MGETAYIGFGANMGDRESKFHEAVDALGMLPVTTVQGRSRLYETEPKGLCDGGPKFLNAIIAIETDLVPGDLMSAMREIELLLGKSPHHRSDMSRSIDLDLILYGDKQVREGQLQVPHPRMHLRAFVLVPLAEIAPLAVHPALGCSIQELLSLLPSHEVEEARPIVEDRESGAEVKPDTTV
jgi:2-amino-4-hydroxy-6-hydroxymethyldihydropteridine diphosphokinase